MWDFGLFEVTFLLKFEIIVPGKCFFDKLVLEVILMMKVLQLILMLRKLRRKVSLIINSNFQRTMLLNSYSGKSKLLFGYLLNKPILIFNDELVSFYNGFINNRSIFLLLKHMLLFLLLYYLHLNLFLLLVVLSNLPEDILHLYFCLLFLLFLFTFDAYFLVAFYFVIFLNIVRLLGKSEVYSLLDIGCNLYWLILFVWFQVLFSFILLLIRIIFLLSL